MVRIIPCIPGIGDVIDAKANRAQGEACIRSDRKSECTIIIVHETAEAFVVHEGHLRIHEPGETGGIPVACSDVVRKRGVRSAKTERSPSNSDRDEFTRILGA